MRSRWLASLPGECVAVAVVVALVAAAAAAAAAAVAVSGPAAMGCGYAEVGYGCGCCYGCSDETLVRRRRSTLCHIGRSGPQAPGEYLQRRNRW